MPQVPAPGAPPVDGQRMQNPQVQRVMTKDLSQFLKSKSDLVNILKVSGQYMLPNYDDIQMDFLRAVLSGQKKLLKNNDARYVSVPKMAEFNTDELYKKALQDPEIRVYMPETADGKRSVGRKYLFTGKH
jgi:hypothetical protein